MFRFICTVLLILLIMSVVFYMGYQSGFEEGMKARIAKWQNEEEEEDEEPRDECN